MKYVKLFENWLNEYSDNSDEFDDCSTAQDCMEKEKKESPENYPEREEDWRALSKLMNKPLDEIMYDGTSETKDIPGEKDVWSEAEVHGSGFAGATHMTMVEEDGVKTIYWKGDDNMSIFHVN